VTLAWTEIHEGELVQVLNRLRVLATGDGDLRIFAVPSSAGAHSRPCGS
jgi:hypothetical protein